MEDREIFIEVSDQLRRIEDMKRNFRKRAIDLYLILLCIAAAVMVFVLGWRLGGRP